MDAQVAQGHFSPQEKCSSSTHRELLAVKYALESFASLLQHDTILWHSDSHNVGRILQVGSSKPDLHAIAVEIYELCVANSNNVLSVWIPRAENSVADFYSRPKDTDDFSIDNKTFYVLQRKLGFCTVDRFADNRNAKTKRFNSKFYCPKTECVNAFLCDWNSITFALQSA